MDKFLTVRIAIKSSETNRKISAMSPPQRSAVLLSALDLPLNADGLGFSLLEMRAVCH